MKYNYIPREELEAQKNVLTPGVADFEIVDAVEAVSKSESEMIKLTVKVWDREGKQTNLFDYLVASPKAVWKIQEFCDAINKPEWYGTEQQLRAESLVGHTGKCMIAMEKNQEYGDRMRIKNYLPPDNVPAPVSPKPQPAEFVDDDIPF